MLICSQANSRSHLSASVMACSFSVSTAVVINLSMWNLALMKLGSLVRVSSTHGACLRGISLGI
jgi:hypothetical protein